MSRRRVGAYHHLTLVARGIAEQVLPGQFVALAVGGPDSSMLLRRAFSVYRARPSGAHGGTVEIVFAEAGRGTRWLARVETGDLVDTVGPLGRPFWLPDDAGCSRVLVGGGYGIAPMFTLADTIAAAGGKAHFVLGAGSADRLFGVVEARRRGGTVVVTTDDGSAGTRGLVTDVLPDVLMSTGADRCLRVRADGHAGRRQPGGRGHGCLLPGPGRGVDGLRNRRLHDVCAADHRGRRRYPDDAHVH